MFGHSKFGVDVSENNGTLTLALHGVIESSTAEIFEAEMASACSKCKNIIADFDKVNFISSAGLRVLLTSQKKMNAEKVLEDTPAIRGMITKVAHLVTVVEE